MKKITILLLLFQVTTFAQSDVTIGRYRKFNSRILGGEVTYLEHLPSGYGTSSAGYPVLLMLNAQNISAFSNSMSILERLGSERIPRMILIGISNEGAARSYWACPGDSERVQNADMFNAFLESEFIPFIRHNYRTVNYRILFGQSNTGLFTWYSLLTKPDLFDAYIIASPTFGFCQDYFFENTKTFLQAHSGINKKIYISYGELDLKELVLNQIHNIQKILADYSPDGMKWEIDLIKNDGHVPYTTLNDALLFFFPKCTITDEMRKQKIDELKKHYASISKEYGFEIYPPEEVLFDMGFEKKRDKLYEESIEIYKYLISIYPNSSRSYYYLGETYREKGDLHSAKEYYRKTLKINPDYRQAADRLKQIK